MRLLLVRPPRRDTRDVGFAVPPLGLAYVASAAQLHGHDVEILDAFVRGWSWRRFEKEVAQYRPDCVGITVMTPMLDVVRRAVQVVRPFTNHIIIGGPHPSALKEKVFQTLPLVDAAVSGEGETTIIPLLAWLASDQTTDPPTGVLVPERRYRPSSVTEDLTTLPRPAWDLLDLGQYRYLFATHPRVATMVTSRGCPFRCSFCDPGVGGRKWRARPASHVVDEMVWLQQHHNIGFINFYDDNFTLRRSRVEAICHEILRRKLSIEWKCEGRADSVDLPMLQLMRRAGCRAVAYGVESGDAQTLKFLRKDITIEQIENAFCATRKAGIRSIAYVILGSPGETVQTGHNTVAFCQKIRADYVQFSTLSPLPGTPLAETAPTPDMSSPLRHGHNPVDSELARPVLSDLAPEELARLVRKAWSQFYLRPGPIWRIARDSVTSGSITESRRLALAMGRWMLEDLTKSVPATAP